MKNPVTDMTNKDNLLSLQEYRDLYAILEQKEMQISSQEEWEEFEKERKALLARSPIRPMRVFRGGSWGDFAGLTRVSFRYWFLASDRDDFFGLRLVKNGKKSE
jgi:formylglycine-generating enzyme required for sulfatase activity